MNEFMQYLMSPEYVEAYRAACMGTVEALALAMLGIVIVAAILCILWTRMLEGDDLALALAITIGMAVLGLLAMLAGLCVNYAQAQSPLYFILRQLTNMAR